MSQEYLNAIHFTQNAPRINETEDEVVQAEEFVRDGEIVVERNAVESADDGIDVMIIDSSSASSSSDEDDFEFYEVNREFELLRENVSRFSQFVNGKEQEIFTSGFSISTYVLLHCKICNLTIEFSENESLLDVHKRLSPGCEGYKSVKYANFKKTRFRYNRKYESQSARMKTFVKFKWPNTSPVSALEMASCGFYYTGLSDLVICFCCGTVQGDWKVGENIWNRHKLAYDCAFIKTSSPRRQDFLRKTEPLKAIQQDLFTKSTSVHFTVDCKICLNPETRATILFRPCGHICCCKQCFKKIGKTCPICREKIKKHYGVFYE